jgi:hypothetical protein
MNNGNADGLVFKTIHPFSDMKFVEELWTDLQKRSVHSYFNSWGWVSTWLLSLPTHIKVDLHIAYLEDIPVAAFFFGKTSGRKYGFLPFRSLALNATANPYYDGLYIEYNAILYDSSISLNFTDILNYIRSLEWDELILPGVSNQFVLDFKLLNHHEKPHYYFLIDHNENAFYVNLQQIRDSKIDILQNLSSNRRSQLRRSIKQYEAQAKIQVKKASSTSEAVEIFEGLVQQHQHEWKKRGWPGVFSNPFFYQFHKNLIQNRFSKDEIQLLHIHTTEMNIGYIYSFVYQGEVLFYQSGFNYQPDNHYRPGLISHYFAILDNLQNNLNVYDFLAGDSTYKRVFATETKPVYWLRLYKNKPRYVFEENILRIKNKIKSMPFIFDFARKMRAFLNKP